MKKSIKRLPKRTQEELGILQELILKHISDVRMIILFGSYAHGNYVLYEDSYEDGIHSSYQSDLDILVITGCHNASKMEEIASRVIGNRYAERMGHRPHPAPPQIVVENTGLMTRVIREKHYFYTEILKKGILLYDDGKYILSKAENQSYRRIKVLAQENYDECYPIAVQLLDHGRFDETRENYKLGAFMLHQACERFYKTLLLTFISDRPRSHKLPYLAARAKSFSREMVTIFPQEEPGDKEAYEKLCNAYIDARYNPDFIVSKEQFDYMIARTEVLREVTAKLCQERLNFYEEKAREEEETSIIPGTL